jgi:uncharacterized protein
MGRHEPRRIDILALAAHAAPIDGRERLADFPRLVDAADDPAAEVAWRAQATRRERPGADALVHLHLTARATVVRHCQRCLEPMPVPLHVQRRIRFVRGEAEAARLDAESDEDVLALEPYLDLLALVEDELLMALPHVPRHERCVDLAAMGGAAQSAPVPDADHPFGVLATLKDKPH